MDIASLLPLIIVLLVLVVVGAMVYMGMREDDGRDPLADRLAIYAEQDIQVESLEDAELKLSFRDRVLMPLVKRLSVLVSRFTPQKQLETTRRQLELAGQNTDPTQFFLQRIFFTV